MVSDRTICRIAGQELTGLIGSLMGDALACSIRVHGISMDPFVRDGDIVKIIPVPGDSTGTGDIVVIVPSENASPLVHRVIGRRMGSVTRELLLKGDRCVYNDGWMPADNVLGVVREVIRDDKMVKWGISGVGKHLLALMSRAGLLARCLSFGSRISGRRVARTVSRISCVSLLTACCCLSAVAEDTAVKNDSKGDEKNKQAAGRTPLVVLKQATIQGQVFWIADKDGKQIPAVDVDIQVYSFDTKVKLFNTTTDDEGKYTLPNLDIGKYRFLVGRLKLELEVTDPEKAGQRVTRVSKKIIVFIPEDMK